jgi:hypothetical protein
VVRKYKFFVYRIKENGKVSTMKRKMSTAWLLIAMIFALGISAANSLQYRARLHGANEVPPVMTTAHGSMRINPVNWGSELAFKLAVFDIPTVVAAHIHCAPVGVNGPVGVTLYAGGPIEVNGLLASGVISAPDAGNGCGWTTVADVVSAIESGGAYVNVHTTAHPSGEIRGQLKVSP